MRVVEVPCGTVAIPDSDDPVEQPCAESLGIDERARILAAVALVEQQHGAAVFDAKVAAVRAELAVPEVADEVPSVEVEAEPAIKPLVSR